MNIVKCGDCALRGTPMCLAFPKIPRMLSDDYCSKGVKKRKMAKLEIEMPDSCKECKFKFTTKHEHYDSYKCIINEVDGSADRRPWLCPLEEIE